MLAALAINVCVPSVDAQLCKSTQFIKIKDGQCKFACKDLRVCTEKQYQTKAPEVIDPAVVKVCRGAKLQDGEFDSNRGCGTLAVCSQTKCETAPVWNSTLGMYTTPRVCEDLITCDSEEYELEQPVIGTDGVCTKNRVCKPLTKCKDDEYESKAPKFDFG